MSVSRFRWLWVLLSLMASGTWSHAAEIVLDEKIHPSALVERRDVWPDGDTTIYNDFLVFHAARSNRLASGDRVTFRFELESPFKFSVRPDAAYAIAYIGFFRENRIGNIGVGLPGPAFGLLDAANLREADIAGTPSRSLNVAGFGTIDVGGFPSEIETMASLQVSNLFQLEDDASAGLFSGFEGTITIPDGFPVGQYTDMGFRIIGHLRTSTSAQPPPPLVAVVPESLSTLAFVALAMVGIVSRGRMRAP